ncbi:uncharacterized protein [Thunnus thynnus]|uniref:uncharacterized protein isoform X1 n=1 Tax=Thunnus thynnus TaxID=8237 RepID=UPI0035296906
MKHRAGFLKLGCAWMMILLQSSNAVHAPKKQAVTHSSCRLKELTALTKKEVEDSLTSFDQANGKHLGTWSSGFPELQVHHNSPAHWAKVQCSLLFMAQALEKLLEDQRDNLNPNDLSLHKKLKDTISRVNMLTACVKEFHGGECSQKPSPPELPEHAFKRKQWGHTLLVASRDYLKWLEHQIGVQISKVKGTNKINHKFLKAGSQKYLEGIGHVL